MTDIPMADLGARLRPLEGELVEAMTGVLRSGRFILGPEVQQLEAEVATLCRTSHGIGVSSGTDALLIALMALDVGPGDEVVTTPLSFFASVGAILRLGARPVLADIDPVTFNLDPEAAAAKITAKTRAVEVVHLFGQCADLGPLRTPADGVGAVLLEDAAQAIGASRDGVPAGGLGQLGCFSFFPTKNLGALGDGGMVVTSDEELAVRLRVLRAHGARPKYHHHLVGGNFRLDALQAALLRVMLPRLEAWNGARRANADRYDRLLTDAGLVERGLITPPPRDPACVHVFHHYVVRVPERRDELQDHLKRQGIATAVYYPLCFHQQPVLRDLGVIEGELPEAERATREVLALPVFPELSRSQQQRVVEEIGRFFDGG